MSGVVQDRPLQGIRVLELGNYIAAPTAGRLLADFGADVVKVERPRTGDELRGWRLGKGTTSMLFRTTNRGKRSVALDLRSDAGREAVLDLVAASDVVLENFRPGTLERWGLGPDVLERVRPGLVLTRISAFGQTGPLAERPGFAAVAEAMGGFRELVGDPPRAVRGVVVDDEDVVLGQDIPQATDDPREVLDLVIGRDHDDGPHTPASSGAGRSAARREARWRRLAIAPARRARTATAVSGCGRRGGRRRGGAGAAGGRATAGRGGALVRPGPRR